MDMNVQKAEELANGIEFAQPAEIERFLREVGASGDDEIDLAGAALGLAALDRPKIDIARYRRHLGMLGEAALKAGAGVDTGSDTDAISLSERIGVVNHVLYTINGYKGDRETYEDLQNANLMRVIDRRRGLPISLAILHMHIARQVGIRAAGVNFPGHFLVRYTSGGETTMVDPFNEGVAIDAAGLRRLLKAVEGDAAELSPHHYQSTNDRAILLRLQNNIKLRLVKAQDYEAALPVAERMLWLSPDNANLWHEIGVLNAQLERYGAAIEALQTVVNLDTGGSLQHEVAELMAQLRRRLN